MKVEIKNKKGKVLYKSTQDNSTKLETFKEALSKKAFLGGAQLQGLDAVDSDFSTRDLSYMNFTGANFSNTNLEVSNLSFSVFREVDFTGSNLKGANLTGANFIRCKFDGSELQGAYGDEVSFRLSTFHKTIFTDSSMRSIDASRTVFTNCTIDDVYWDEFDGYLSNSDEVDDIDSKNNNHLYES